MDFDMLLVRPYPSDAVKIQLCHSSFSFLPNFANSFYFASNLKNKLPHLNVPRLTLISLFRTHSKFVQSKVKGCPIQRKDLIHQRETNFLVSLMTYHYKYLVSGFNPYLNVKIQPADGFCQEVLGSWYLIVICKHHGSVCFLHFYLFILQKFKTSEAQSFLELILKFGRNFQR